jgi:hypothetical protein
MKRDGKTVKKNDLPKKICPICERSITWRKKWQRDWDSVVYCGERCRRHRFLHEA